MTQKLKTLLVAGGLMALAACRGQKSEEPPVHLIHNMDSQTSYKPQEENTFFEDGRAQRKPVDGTVAWGSVQFNRTDFKGFRKDAADYLRADKPFYEGKDGEAFVTKLPAQVHLDAATLDRGEARYNIYCAPCHSKTGDGNGIVKQRSRGAMMPANLHDDRLVKAPVGQIYSAIANGVNNGNMPAHKMIPVEDRWAIVAYVRALQLSQRASLDDVPSEVRAQKGWSK